MAKLFCSMATNKWSKYLRWQDQRYFSCEFDGKWSGAPLCKGRQIPKEEKTCPPKPGSCYAVMGDCPIKNFPKCSKPHIKSAANLTCCSDKRLSHKTCAKPEEKFQKQEIKKPFISMWETCGVEQECPAMQERLDNYLYKPTDKRDRIYTQTWKSCHPVVRKRKVCCLNEMCMLPPINKRLKTDCPTTAKEQDFEQLKQDYNILKKCLEEKITPKIPNQRKGGKCQKIVLPCCRPVDKNLTCYIHRKKNCVKECCPHPSFSECDHAAFNTELPSECRCVHFINQCDANRFLNRKQFINLPPPVKGWPPKERPK